MGVAEDSDPNVCGCGGGGKIANRTSEGVERKKAKEMWLNGNVNGMVGMCPLLWPERITKLLEHLAFSGGRIVGAVVSNWASFGVEQ